MLKTSLSNDDEKELQEALHGSQAAAQNRIGPRAMAPQAEKQPQEALHGEQPSLQQRG